MKYDTEQEPIDTYIRRIELIAREKVKTFFSGLYRSRFRGSGLEIEDLREFASGDDIRSISWSKMAALGKPYVKTFRQERELLVYFIVDISGSQNFTTAIKQKRRVIAEALSPILFSALENRDRVGLMLFSNIQEHYVAARRGDRHALAILEDILNFQASNTKTDIKHAVEQFMYMQKKPAIVFFCSDFLDSGYESALSILAKKHDLILMHVEDPFETAVQIDYKKLGVLYVEDMEDGTESIVDMAISSESTQFYIEKKHKLLEFVQKHSIDMVSLSTISDPYQGISNFFEKRKRTLR